MPARIIDHIRELFNALDQGVLDVQDEEAEDEEEQNDQDSDSSNAELESLDLDQPKDSGVQKSPEKEITPEVEITTEGYNPGCPARNADDGNLLNFDLKDFFGKEYLSFLDSNEPHQAQHIPEPSVAIGTGKESGNPLVLTTALEQQTLP